DFGDIAFSEATFHIGRKEFDYWSDPETINTIGEARVPFAVGAKRRLDEIADVVQLFEDQDQILPNVTAIASYGHTPGHMSFMIDGEAGNAFVIGDAIGNHHIAFARPDLPSGSDQNAEEGIQTRVAMMDMLAADNVPIIGFHLPDGGMGRVARDGDGYVFNAE
ncbi:MAG: MBL fold metallo-hydrolase, partial [Pseudomonadota bacterium]|nr:MBL fold metallo-hydrolase [Pseudomonadota bacterium]